MIQSFLKYFFSLIIFFITNSSFGKVIEVKFTHQKKHLASIELSKELNVISLYIIDCEPNKSIYFQVENAGIYHFHIQSHFSFYLYFNNEDTLRSIVNLDNKTYNVLNSPNTSSLINLNNLANLEITKLKELNQFKSKSALIKAFEIISEEILKSDNPEIIDATFDLLELEGDIAELQIPLALFIDFEMEVKQKYPDYKFRNIDNSLKHRKSTQSGYYWKY